MFLGCEKVPVLHISRVEFMLRSNLNTNINCWENRSKIPTQNSQRLGTWLCSSCIMVHWLGFLSWKFHFVFPSSWGIFRLSSTTNSMSTAGRAQSFIVLHCWNNRHGDSHVFQSMCSRPTVRSLASSNNIFGYFLIRTKEESEEMKIIFIQISNFCMTQQSVVERKWAELPANTRAIYIESNASKCMRTKRVGLSIVKYKKEHEKDETQHWP